MTTSKAPTAEASLRAAVREAHGVLKDMRGVLPDPDDVPAWDEDDEEERGRG